MSRRRVRSASLVETRSSWPTATFTLTSARRFPDRLCRNSILPDRTSSGRQPLPAPISSASIACPVCIQGFSGDLNRIGDVNDVADRLILLAARVYRAYRLSYFQL